MPWLEIDYLGISPEIWSKLLEKHGIEAGPLRAFLLEQRRHEFRWITDWRGDRAELTVHFDGRPTTVVLWPRIGAPADHWNLATAFRSRA